MARADAPGAADSRLLCGADKGLGCSVGAEGGGAADNRMVSEAATLRRSDWGRSGPLLARIGCC